MRTILVTGAAGFIGSNFVRLLMKRGEPVKFVVVDKLTYAGNLANLEDLLGDPSRLAFVKADICDVEMIQDLTVAALNEARRKVEESLKGKLGGMLPPGMM